MTKILSVAMTGLYKKDIPNSMRDSAGHFRALGFNQGVTACIKLVLAEEAAVSKNIGETIKEFYRIFDTENVWQGEDDWTKNVPIGNLEEWLRKALVNQFNEGVKKERERLIKILDNGKDAYMMPVTRARFDKELNKQDNL